MLCCSQILFQEAQTTRKAEQQKSGHRDGGRRDNNPADASDGCSAGGTQRRKWQSGAGQPLAVGPWGGCKDWQVPLPELSPFGGGDRCSHVPLPGRKRGKHQKKLGKKNMHVKFWPQITPPPPLFLITYHSFRPSPGLLLGENPANRRRLTAWGHHEKEVWMVCQKKPETRFLGLDPNSAQGLYPSHILAPLSSHITGVPTMANVVARSFLTMANHRSK